MLGDYPNRCRDLHLYFVSKGYEVEGGKDLLKTT